MNKIIIRPARNEDLPTLLQFEQGIIEAERPLDSTLKDGNISYYDIASMINEEGVEVLVAEIKGELVGSGYARIEKSQNYVVHSRHTYLGFMFVPMEHRGKGIIQKILEKLKEWTLSQGIYEMKLEVYHNNPSAIRAYEKAGFSKYLMGMRIGLD